MSGFENFFEPKDKKDSELLAIEMLALECQTLIQSAMMESGVSQKELAERLNCTPARVSQLLSTQGHNITLKTLARILHALGHECHVAKGSKPSAKKKVKESTGQWEGRDLKFGEMLSAAGNDNRAPMLISALAEAA